MGTALKAPALHPFRHDRPPRRHLPRAGRRRPRPARRPGGPTALAGRGLEGDRYAAGEGSFSRWPGRGREVTLVAAEALAEAAAEFGVAVADGEHRRNLVVEGVPLDDLRGVPFAIGGRPVRGRPGVRAVQIPRASDGPGPDLRRARPPRRAPRGRHRQRGRPRRRRRDLGPRRPVPGAPGSRAKLPARTCAASGASPCPRSPTPPSTTSARPATWSTWCPTACASKSRARTIWGSAPSTTRSRRRSRSTPRRTCTTVLAAGGEATCSSSSRRSRASGFLDSVRLLADRAGIEIREAGADNPEADRRATLTAALRFAAGYYYRQLGTAAGARGLAYVKERAGSRRKPSSSSGSAWRRPPGTGWRRPRPRPATSPTCWRPSGWRRSGRGAATTTCSATGSCSPSCRPSARCSASAGGSCPTPRPAATTTQPAKYVNSPETEVYHKSRVLYGMKQAKRAIRTEREAVVVEGYADVVSLWDAGVRNVVAASGTALGTPEQMDALEKVSTSSGWSSCSTPTTPASRRSAQGDRRGARRRARALRRDPSRRGRPRLVRPPVRRRRVPVGYLSRRAAGLRGVPGRPRPGRSGALATPEGKAGVVAEVLATIKRLGNPIQAGEYLRRAADALDVYESDLRRQFEGQAAPRRVARRRPSTTSRPRRLPEPGPRGASRGVIADPADAGAGRADGRARADPDGRRRVLARPVAQARRRGADRPVRGRRPSRWPRSCGATTARPCACWSRRRSSERHGAQRQLARQGGRDAQAPRRQPVRLGRRASMRTAQARPRRRGRPRGDGSRCSRSSGPARTSPSSRPTSTAQRAPPPDRARRVHGVDGGGMKGEGRTGEPDRVKREDREPVKGDAPPGAFRPDRRRP